MAYQSSAAVLAAKGQIATQSIVERQTAAEETAAHARLVEKSLHRQQKTSTARSAAISRIMKLLTTYADFPFPQEKKRILSWFDE